MRRKIKIQKTARTSNQRLTVWLVKLPLTNVGVCECVERRTKEDSELDVFKFNLKFRIPARGRQPPRVRVIQVVVPCLKSSQQLEDNPSIRRCPGTSRLTAASTTNARELSCAPLAWIGRTTSRFCLMPGVRLFLTSSTERRRNCGTENCRSLVTTGPSSCTTDITMTRRIRGTGFSEAPFS
jgi:hypothetical protein